KAFDEVLLEMAQEADADTEVNSEGLRPGMKLSRPLLSPHGSVLLPVGFSFSVPVIKQVRELEARDGLNLSFFVKQAAAAGAAKAKPPAAAPSASPKVQHA
ncbi:MAG: hypothetical protein K2W93_15505, partial [Burkholderiaceae bacterium]|nr:hypothetical protein [Burkholderiaceae bacterium]